MKAMEDLKEMLEDELKKITKKGDINPQELEAAYKAVDILKDLETIKAMKGYDEGQSQGGQSYNSYDGNSNRGSYDGMSNGGSYNGRSYGPIWNQDMMRPYSMGSYRGSYDGNSRDGRAGRDADSDGQYSENSYYEGSHDYSGRRGRDARGRYTSREGGSYEYSRHSEKERMIDKLETMADVATDHKTKMAIEQCIDKLER